MKIIQKISIVVLAIFFLWTASFAQKDKRPNVVLILADDLGYSDLGSYGGEIKTPNLDKLAKNGVRFTNFYNGGRCCPTRASLLTGVYPHQAGIGRMTTDQNLPGYQGRLSKNVVTIAEVLGASGYNTAMVGKWHVSNTKQGKDHLKNLNNQEILETFSDLDSYPTNRGFDEFYGIIWGVVNVYDPFSLVKNETAIKSVPKGYHITDAMTDNAIEYVDKFSKTDKPMFLYVAYTAPHWGVQAFQKDIEKYEDTYKPGWDQIRNARYERQKKLGIADAKNEKLSERHAPELDWTKQKDKDYRAGAMAAHAAMTEQMDANIGRLIEKLKKTGKLDNTLILFLSDNGASPETPKEPGFDRPSETRDGRKVLYYDEMVEKNVLPGDETTFGSIGNMWANVSNAPFRFWKAQMYEGGIATPLICHFPKMRKKGIITNQSGHIIDVMATALDAANVEYPAEFKGNQIIGLEGKSLLPILEGKMRTPHEAIFWEHFGSRAVREGVWKIVARPERDWELYDLANDRSETNNLAAKYPEKVKQMAAKWDVWAKRAKVLPMPPLPKYVKDEQGD